MTRTTRHHYVIRITRSGLSETIWFRGFGWIVTLQLFMMFIISMDEGEKRDYLPSSGSIFKCPSILDWTQRKPGDQNPICASHAGDRNASTSVTTFCLSKYTLTGSQVGRGVTGT